MQQQQVMIQPSIHALHNPVRKITLERVILEDSLLLVTSSSTAWVNVNHIRSDVSVLESLYKDVVKQAKFVGAKISYRNGTKKAIAQVYAEGALAEYEKYQTLYTMLKNAWAAKVAIGIFSPASDDEDLCELSDVAHSLDALTHRNKPLGKAMTVYHELLEFKSMLANYQQNEASGVTIYL
jgi:hypothetical protein